METPGEYKLSPILTHNNWKLLAHKASTPLTHCTSDESGYSTNGTFSDDTESTEILEFAITRLKTSSTGLNMDNIKFYSSPDESANSGKLMYNPTFTNEMPLTNKKCLNTAVPLNGQEIGKKYIDFLNELSNRRNCFNVISKILMYLSPFELCKVSWVSRTWKNVCLNDANARSVIESYLSWKKYIKENEKENINLFKTPTFDKLSRRIPFVNVQNTISKKDVTGMQEKKTAPWPKSRYQLFTEEANKCNPGERLQICPRCGSPSRVINIEQRGMCSDIYCAFDFCTVCLNEFHKQIPCKTKVRPINKIHHIGSKQSKRKLKRL